MEKNLNPEEFQELKEYLESETKNQKRVMKIIFDGKQTAVRIPLEFVEVMKIDPKKDMFEFEIEIPPKVDDDNQPKLVGRLIKNG